MYDALRVLRDERGALERAWAAQGARWADRRRDRFERHYLQPALRLTADVARDLEAVADIVTAALRTFRQP
jgi:hypothetical protein